MPLKRFENADRSETFEKGRFDVINVGPMTIGRAAYDPGWQWSTHIGSRSGQRWCATEHVGIVISGAAAVSYPNGIVEEMHAGDAFHIKGEHDSWVIGDEPYVSLHLMGASQYAS
jgi:hypothetical protein